MKISHAKTKTEDLYIPVTYSNVIKNNVFVYFIYGQGWKKTKKFEVLNIELPDYGKELSWLEICYLVEKWGILVGEYYANHKTAGIVARQTIKGFYTLFERCKHLLDRNDENDIKFFDLLRCDYMLSCFGYFTFDIVTFDNILGKLDPDYDGEKTTYKGEKDVSLKDYVKIKFGNKYVEIINTLLKCEEKQGTQEG